MAAAADVAASAGELVRVKVSHYWPALGGVNCFRFVGGQCISPTASGAPWQEWIGRGAACVPEWPFGTTFTLPGGERFTCVDRGGAIKTGADGLPWVDLLVEHAPVPFGRALQNSRTATKSSGISVSRPQSPAAI